MYNYTEPAVLPAGNREAIFGCTLAANQPVKTWSYAIKNGRRKENLL